MEGDINHRDHSNAVGALQLGRPSGLSHLQARGSDIGQPGFLGLRTIPGEGLSSREKRGTQIDMDRAP